MIGTFHYTGVVVTFQGVLRGEYGWTAVLHFQDDGFADQRSVTGRLETHYQVWTPDPAEALTRAIDEVTGAAQHLGIQPRPVGEPALLGLILDNYDATHPSQPRFWQVVQAEAERRGWASYKD